MWRITRRIDLFSSLPTVSRGVAPNGGYPTVRLATEVLGLAAAGPPRSLQQGVDLSHFQSIPGRVFAFAKVLYVGLEPTTCRL